jgi:hypothetical protein
MLFLTPRCAAANDGKGTYAIYGMVATAVAGLGLVAYYLIGNEGRHEGAPISCLFA